MMCMNIGTPKTINFPFGTNGKMTVLGVPILKYFRVVMIFHLEFFPRLFILLVLYDASVYAPM